MNASKRHGKAAQREIAEMAKMPPGKKPPEWFEFLENEPTVEI